MESPAFRGSTITTTALVHSSSPPGFIADDKDLSPKGKGKTHNGCVVREKEKIILLKRVYGSPVRRSSRVRRKGCAVLPRSKIRHRHSDPAFYPHLHGRDTKTQTGRDTRSMDYTPIRRTIVNEDLPMSDTASTPDLLNARIQLQSAEDSTSPDGLSSLHLTPPNKYSEDDFFNSDGTPRRRLMVKITETPEIRRKLAEVESKGILPEVYSHSALRNLQCHPHLQERGSDPCGEFLEFSSESSSEDDLPESLFDECLPAPERMSLREWQARNASKISRECFSHSQADNKILCQPESSGRTADSENREDHQMHGVASDRYDSSLHIHIEPVDTSNELGNLRDPADEVLYISPLPFETSKTSFSFSDAVHNERLSPSSGECSHKHHDDVSFVPIHREQAPDSIDINLPAHPSAVGRHIQNQSKDGSLVHDCAMSEPPWSPDHVDNNQLCYMDLQATEMQPKCVMECLPPMNGLRPNQMLLMHLSTPDSSRSVNRSVNHLYNEGQQEDKIGIMNVTPNHRVLDNMKGKEPSPTYASQANSESPYSPSSADLTNQDDCDKEITPQSRVTSTSSSLKSYSCHGICSPSSKSNSNDNFQDFSEFDFLKSDSNPPIDQILPSYEHGLDNTCAASPNKGSVCDSSPLNCDTKPSKSIEEMPKYSGSKDHQTPINWGGMLESDAAYHAKSAQDVSRVCDSDHQFTSAVDFLANNNPESTRKKKQKKPVPRRSSMRIARRMSLMLLEEDTKITAESNEATVEIPASKSQTKEPTKCDTSSVVSRPGEGSIQESNTRTHESNKQSQSSVQVSSSSSCIPPSPDDGTRKITSDLILHADVVSAESIHPKSKCQPNTNTNNPITLKTIKRKPKNNKQSNMQSRRKSVRRNSAVLPVQKAADQPVLNSTCSESISAELDANLQFEDDTENLSKTKPQTVKSERKPSRRRSLRLNPVVQSPKVASPVIPTLDATNVCTCSHSTTTCTCTGSTIDSLDQLETNAQCSTSSRLGTNSVPLTEPSDSESSVCSGMSETDFELPFISECNAASIKGKKGPKSMRRRSTRLIKLSIQTMEDQPASNQTSHAEETLQSHPLEDKEWNSFEQFGKTAECSPSPVSTDSGLDIQHDLDKCDIQATLFGENDSSQVSLISSGLDDASIFPDAVENHQRELLDGVELAQDPVEAGQKARPRRKSSVISYAEKNDDVKPKKNGRKNDDAAVEELYLKRGENKTLKSNNLETIFEEPHVSKMGGPLYIGVRKCKRAVNFPEHPWLPRKKRKLPKNKNGRLKRRKKGTRDPSIEMKLEALLAEWTPVSPPSIQCSYY